jgi:prolyl oligopeptidase
MTRATPRTYPGAHRLPLEESIHGRTIADPYRWLEDPTTAESRAWCAAQQACFEAARNGWQARQPLLHRLRQRWAVGDAGPPVRRRGRYFFNRRLTGQEQRGLVLRGPADMERTLIDSQALDGTEMATLDGWSVSWNGQLVAYRVSHGGTEESSLRVLDVETGMDVDGPIDRTRATSIGWLPDDTGFYYTRRLRPDLVPADEAQYHRRVYLHMLGDDPADDREVFGGSAPKTALHYATTSGDGRWLQILTREGTAPRGDIYIADLMSGDPATPPLRPVQVGVDASTRLLFPRPDGPLGGRIVVLTNLESPAGRICVTTVDDPTPSSWQDLLRAEDGTVLTGAALLDGPLVDRPVLLVLRRRDAVSTLTAHDMLTGTPIHDVSLPGLGTVTGLIGQPEGDDAWFTYTDYTTSPRVYRYEPGSRSTQRWAGCPATEAEPAVAIQQVEYPSADGTRIPMFVVSARTDGAERPTLLTAYGGFGASMTPEYDPSLLTWVESGGVVAVALVRGGGERGRSWHRAGTLGGKQRAVDDLVAAAEHLIGAGWTTPPQLGITGSSNGGLLVGAALTQRPELFGAAACTAPLLDMVRYERSGLGALWTAEYGTAAEPDQLDWLHAYSPLHRVRRGTRYPSVLLSVSEGDTRVDPLHARKFCAALQWATSSDRPILIRSEHGVGHGSRALSRQVEASADRLAFLATELGLHIDLTRIP